MVDWIGDLPFWQAAQQREQSERDEEERRRKNGKQSVRQCNACRKRFDSGNALFRHLSATPKHRCQLNHVSSFTLKCANCPDFVRECSNVSQHDKKHRLWRKDGTPDGECDGCFVYSINICLSYSSWRSQDKVYSILDFDSNDVFQNGRCLKDFSPPSQHLNSSIKNNYVSFRTLQSDQISIL